MPESRTRLLHTCPTEEPFDCITGDLSGEGFLLVVDLRTHELLIERETGESLTVRVNPRGITVAGAAAGAEQGFLRDVLTFWRLRRGAARKVMTDGKEREGVTE